MCTDARPDAAASLHGTPEVGRERARPLFLRALGVVAAVAFLDLAAQVTLLVGAEGLLPVSRFLARAGEALGSSAPLRFPTLFWLGAPDAALIGACVAGAALSAALVLLWAPRACLAGIWCLYLSLTVACQEFLGFQWDNLLLETVFLAIPYAPGGWRPFRGVPPPSGPIARGLLLGLLVRLHFESGVAKLVSGDPHWPALTAMISYWETAPLPTSLGWWAHQLPDWADRALAGATLVLELVVPWLALGPRRARWAAVAALVPLHVVIQATGNYGVFNLLSLALCIPALEGGLAPRRDRGERLRPRSLLGWAGAAAAAGLLGLQALDFAAGVCRWEPPAPIIAVHRAVVPWRTVNSYHLFAQMTLVRKEVEIEGSDDGETWSAYEFHAKPGDPKRRPAYVAPRQPRVDFRFWFLPLGGRTEMLNRLVDRMTTHPEVLAALFAVDPFGGRAPRYVRVGMWQYTFTDEATRRSTGLWWDRVFLGFHPYVHDARGDSAPRY